jgi:hypothetical protein
VIARRADHQKPPQMAVRNAAQKRTPGSLDLGVLVNRWGGPFRTDLASSPNKTRTWYRLVNTDARLQSLEPGSMAATVATGTETVPVSGMLAGVVDRDADDDEDANCEERFHVKVRFRSETDEGERCPNWMRRKRNPKRFKSRGLLLLLIRITPKRSNQTYPSDELGVTSLLGRAAADKNAAQSTLSRHFWRCRLGCARARGLTLAPTTPGTAPETDIPCN